MKIEDDRVLGVMRRLRSLFEGGKGENCFANRWLQFKQRRNLIFMSFIREKIAKLKIDGYVLIYKTFYAPHNEVQNRFIVKNRTLDIIFDGQVVTAEYMRTPDVSCWVFEPEIEDWMTPEELREKL